MDLQCFPPCNNLKIIKVISNGYKASTFKIPYQGIAICQSHSLMILLTYISWWAIQWKYVLVDFYQHNLFFHILLIKFCTNNPTSNINNYLWNIVLEPSCKVVTTLQGCEHLVYNATTSWQPCYNLSYIRTYVVVARLLQPGNFHMG